MQKDAATGYTPRPHQHFETYGMWHIVHVFINVAMQPHALGVLSTGAFIADGIVSW